MSSHFVVQMIQVQVCTQLEPLAENLIQLLRDHPLPPLEEEMIVVAQNRGMRAWVEYYIARTLGCAASLPKVAPSGLEKLLIRRVVHPRLPPEAVLGAYEIETLTWRVLRCLEDLPREPVYKALHTYLRSAPGSKYALARRIAACFDAYGVFRGDLLEAWEAGINPLEAHPHAAWQAALWRQLVSRAPYHPAKLRAMLLSHLDGAHRTVLRLPPRVSIFGAGLFPAAYLQVLHAIATCGIDVTFYTVASTRGNWQYAHGDLPQGRLLQAFGGQGRELFNVLDAISGGTCRYVHVADHEGGANTLLQRLQVDVMGQVERGDSEHERYAILPDDRSLQLHSCHSPVRELEVLRDQLFDAFEADPSLRPEDVLVVVSDLGTYAPLLDAVWGAEQVEAQRLRYHVIDSLWTDGRRVVEALRQLLALAGTRMTTTRVVELLGNSVIRRSADIRLGEMSIVQTWVRESQVRWGRDGRQKQRYDLPEDDVHTWVAGLERLLLGYASGPTDDLVVGRAPLGESTTDRADLLGRLVHWLRQLFTWLEALEHPRTFAQWRDTMDAFVDTLLTVYSEHEEAALQHVLESIAALQEQRQLLAQAGPGDTLLIRGNEMKHYMMEQLDAYREEERFITGRVTVSDFITARFLPHRLVAMVGMNDDLFPRRPSENALDLMAHEPRAGDTDIRSADKQLFLDALLAARDRVVITFVGRSQKDNSERAPSVAIDVLLDVLCRSCTVPGFNQASADNVAQRVRDRLVVSHRLQPFSAAYFDESDPRLFSYVQRHCRSAGKRGAAQRQPFIGERFGTSDAPHEVSLPDLAQAWMNPSKYFCTRRLGLYLRGTDEALLEVEPLEFDTLHEYQLKQQLLAFEVAGLSPGEQQQRLTAIGTLPPGELGRAWHKKVRDKVAPVAMIARLFDWSDPRTLHLEGSSWGLTARFEHLTPECQVRFRAAKIKPKDWIQAWVSHVVANAYAEMYGGLFPRTTVLIGEASKGGAEVWHLPPIDEALAHLQDLIEGLRTSWAAPPPLFEKASQAYAENGSMEQAAKVFIGTQWSRGDLSDGYIALCCRGRDPLNEEPEAFQGWAQRLWHPLLAHQNTGLV